jgi:MFS family permease
MIFQHKNLSRDTFILGLLAVLSVVDFRKPAVAKPLAKDDMPAKPMQKEAGSVSKPPHRHRGERLENAVKQEKQEPEFDYRKKDRDKHLSIVEGSLNSASIGLTDNFISAFAIALGVSNTVIAMLATLPKLIGAVMQLWVQKAESFFPTRKRHMVFFAILQAFTWVPLIFAPQFENPGAWILLFVTLHTMFGMLIGPVWNSFMGDVVDESERGRFFGRRNMYTGATAFVSTMIAGGLLSLLKPTPLIGFAILFFLAFVFRLLSAYFLSKMDDPPEKDLNSEEPDIPEFIRTAEKTPFGRFTIFLMLFYVAVYVSSPFFAVYQLSILKFDYFQFTILACASAISSFLSMILWGKYVDQIGSKNVLVASGMLIPLVPLGYALTTQFWVLILIELFSGAVWAGFNLSVSTYLFDATDRKNRTREIAEYTLLIQVAIFFGAMMGSAFLGFFDRTSPAGYVTVFILSAILRLGVVLLFYKTLQEMRIVEVPVKDRLFKRFVSIKPQQGIIYEPSVENRRLAGRFAKEEPRKVKEDVQKMVEKGRGVKRPESAIKKMERQEDDADFEAYKRKLK